VAGLPPDLLRHFTPQIEALGVVVVAGIGGAPPPEVLASGRSGRRDRAQLVKGTSPSPPRHGHARRGDRVLAFGHPYLLQGAADLPMARTEIYMTLASVAGSNKLARSSTRSGPGSRAACRNLRSDLAIPSMIPLTVEVKTPSARPPTATSWRVTGTGPAPGRVTVAGSLASTPSRATSDPRGHHALPDGGPPGRRPGRSLHGLRRRRLRGARHVQRCAGNRRRDLPEPLRGASRHLDRDPRSRIEEDGSPPSRGLALERRGVAGRGGPVQCPPALLPRRGGHADADVQDPEGTPRGDLTVLVGGPRSSSPPSARSSRGGSPGRQPRSDHRHREPDPLGDVLYAKAIRRSGAVVQSAVLPALPLRSSRPCSRTGGGRGGAMAEAVVWEGRLPIDSIVTEAPPSG